MCVFACLQILLLDSEQSWYNSNVYSIINSCIIQALDEYADLQYYL